MAKRRNVKSDVSGTPDQHERNKELAQNLVKIITRLLWRTATGSFRRAARWKSAYDYNVITMHRSELSG